MQPLSFQEDALAPQKHAKASTSTSATMTAQQVSETPEETVSQAQPLEQSPATSNAWKRLDLHRKVSGLKGKPFTAAFLAAATGVEVSEV